MLMLLLQLRLDTGTRFLHRKQNALAATDTEASVSVAASTAQEGRTYLKDSRRMCSTTAGEVKTLGIDPITVFYQVLQLAAEQNRSYVQADGTISQRGWGWIKRETMRLYNRLLNLDCHVVVTAREATIYDDDTNKAIATKGEAHKMTPYLFDITLELVKDIKSGQRYANVIKDRSGILEKQGRLPLNQKTVWEWLEPVREMMAQGEVAHQQSELDAAEQDAEAAAKAERKANGAKVRAEVKAMCKTRGIPETEMGAYLKEKGVSPITDMNAVKALKLAQEFASAYGAENGDKPDPEVAAELADESLREAAEAHVEN